MSRSHLPDWYHPSDVVTTVREAEHAYVVSTDAIVDILASEELNAPKERINQMVEDARDRIAEDDIDPTNSLATPRALQARFVDPNDMTHLGTRDFATVLGVMFSRYEGKFRTSEAVDDVAVDLFWNQQYKTAAFRTISRPATNPVEKDNVIAIVEGDTTPASGRSPSSIGIISNAGFTDSAREFAEEYDIGLFGVSHLARWFEETRLTYDVLGLVLEGGEYSVEELTEFVDRLPPLPESIHETDPLKDLSEEVWSGTDDGQVLQTGVKQPIPVPDRRLGTGEKGALYANPDDDGDFGAFDRFMDELQEETE